MAGPNIDRTTTNTVAVVFLVTAVYVFSPPIVAFACIRLGLDNDTFGPIMGAFYAPLVLLYNHFPPYRALMDFCFQALGVN